MYLVFVLRISSLRFENFPFPVIENGFSSSLFSVSLAPRDLIFTPQDVGVYAVRFFNVYSEL